MIFKIQLTIITIEFHISLDMRKCKARSESFESRTEQDEDVRAKSVREPTAKTGSAMQQPGHVLRKENMSSRVKILKQQLAQLDGRLLVAWQQEQKAAIDHVRQVMNFFNLVPNQLRVDRRGTYNTKPVQMKYQDPITGATWSGRGRAPSWIRNRNYDDFLVRHPDDVGAD